MSASDLFAVMKAACSPHAVWSARLTILEKRLTVPEPKAWCWSNIIYSSPSVLKFSSVCKSERNLLCFPPPAGGLSCLCYSFGLCFPSPVRHMTQGSCLAEKALGVLISSWLNVSPQCAHVGESAAACLDSESVASRTGKAIVPLQVALVKSYLEYCVVLGLSLQGHWVT